MSGGVWLSQLARAVQLACSGEKLGMLLGPLWYMGQPPQQRINYPASDVIMSLLKSSGLSSCVTIKNRKRKNDFELDVKRILKRGAASVGVDGQSKCWPTLDMAQWKRVTDIAKEMQTFGSKGLFQQLILGTLGSTILLLVHTQVWCPLSVYRLQGPFPCLWLAGNVSLAHEPLEMFKHLKFFSQRNCYSCNVLMLLNPLLVCKDVEYQASGRLWNLQTGLNLLPITAAEKGLLNFKLPEADFNSILM